MIFVESFKNLRHFPSLHWQLEIKYNILAEAT